MGKARPEVVAQRLVAGVADRDDGRSRSQRFDLARGVAQVLALQARQAVDLDRVDERAEAEGRGEADARPTRPANAEPGAEQDDQRHEDGDQVAAVEVVGAECAEQERDRDTGQTHRRGDPRPAPLLRVPAPEQQRQCRQCQQRRDRERDRSALPVAVLVAVVLADQLRPGPFESFGQRLFGDPARVGVAGLSQSDRRQQRASQGHDPDRDADPSPRHRIDVAFFAAPRAKGRHQQQGSLGDDDEGGEVVGGEGQGREERPECQVSPRPRPSRPGEEEEGERDEQEDEGVGAGVLGEPDQHRADRDDRRRDQARPARQRQRPAPR